MRVTVFTSNHPRHISLVERLAERGDSVFAVMETTTLMSGRVADFYGNSPTMSDYFERVLTSERRVFGMFRFAPGTVRVLPLRMGDASHLDEGTLGDALNADAFLVFGASYIRGWMGETLAQRGALNIHMGVSPLYRGSSTNFWALYDGHPEFVGATLHRLTLGLDSGPILMHVFPETADCDPFDLGMRAVKSAHDAAIDLLADGRYRTLDAVPQDRSLQMRYTRNADFTDSVAAEYLDRLPTPTDVGRALARRDLSNLVRPRVGS